MCSFELTYLLLSIYGTYPKGLYDKLKMRHILCILGWKHSSIKIHHVSIATLVWIDVSFLLVYEWSTWLGNINLYGFICSLKKKKGSSDDLLGCIAATYTIPLIFYTISCKLQYEY